jgi:selenium metabolism protein YedF
VLDVRGVKMTEERLDCRGLACPSPVLKTKELVERGGVTHVRVLVDNPAAKENVSRFLGRAGYEVTSSERDGTFEVTGARDELSVSCEVTESSPGEDQGCRIAVLIGTDHMGRGDDLLGGKLLFNFVNTLKEMGTQLCRLIFLNGGVKLTVEGSESVPALRELEDEGVHILVCGTCLNHFGLLEKKLVGETTNMLDIVTALQVADKVISVT